MELIRRVLNSPFMSLLVGVVLTVTSFQEVLLALEEDIAGLRDHHGVLVFGIFMLLKGFIDVAYHARGFLRGTRNR